MSTKNISSLAGKDVVDGVMTQAGRVRIDN